MSVAVDIGLGLMGLGGGLFTNTQNERIARDNRRFQERMSSTSAQRAVEDYRRAGLNPALAYERPSSSPGGSTAVMQDAVRSGISSGLDSARARKEIELAQEQKSLMLAQKAQMNEGVEKSKMERRVLAEQELAAKQAREFMAILQPYQKRKAAAEALMFESDVPEARNRAALAEKMGIYSNLLRFIRPR